MASERSVTVGGVQIGGGAPPVVQSMTLTKTYDVDATMGQIADLASAGCEIVRVAVPKSEDADALKKLVYLSPVPLIADIHFNASLALKAIDAGVAAVRINPGNIGGPDLVLGRGRLEVVEDLDVPAHAVSVGTVPHGAKRSRRATLTPWPANAR